MNKGKSQPVNSTKRSKFLYIGVYGVTLFLEIIVYLLVAASAVAMFVALGYSFNFYSKHCYECGNQFMTFFGMFATVSFVPILGLLATLVTAYRNSLSEIEGDLAKCTGVEVQFRMLPHYANTETFHELQQSVNEERNVLKKLGYAQNDLESISEDILDYDYQVAIDFKQELAELYKITLCDLSLVCDGHQYVIRNKKNIMNSVSTVKDLSGIKKDIFAGEHACVFVRRDENNNDISMQNLIRVINKANTNYSRFACVLNFQKRNFFSKKMLFPISRFLLDKILKFSLRRRIVVAEFDFDAFKSIAGKKPNSVMANSAVYDLNITNISFVITHDSSWHKYLKSKLKSVNGEVKNEVCL